MKYCAEKIFQRDAPLSFTKLLIASCTFNSEVKGSIWKSFARQLHVFWIWSTLLQWNRKSSGCWHPVLQKLYYGIRSYQVIDISIFLLLFLCLYLLTSCFTYRITHGIRSYHSYDLFVFVFAFLFAYVCLFCVLFVFCVDIRFCMKNYTESDLII